MREGGREGGREGEHCQVGVHQLWFSCRILDEMKPAYSITYGSSRPVVKRGKLEPVRLTLSQRTGNKKVTLVDNLHYYGIPPADVAQTLQKMAAASTTCELWCVLAWQCVT